MNENKEDCFFKNFFISGSVAAVLKALSSFHQIHHEKRYGGYGYFGSIKKKISEEGFKSIWIQNFQKSYPLIIALHFSIYDQLNKILFPNKNHLEIAPNMKLLHGLICGGLSGAISINIYHPLIVFEKMKMMNIQTNNGIVFKEAMKKGSKKIEFLCLFLFT